MIRVVLLAAGIALSAGLAEAESVRVLSGEHKDFSRIVLVFGNPIGWTEGKTPEGFEVRFDRTDIAPDLSRVFEKIPKDRIRDVTFDAESGTLKLSAGCACEMEIFEAGRHTIAIDIKPGSAAPVGPEDFTQAKKPFRAFPFGRPQEQRPVSVIGPNPISPVRVADGGAAPGVPQIMNDRVRTLETALLEQLGRAATQGVAEIEPGGKARTAHRSEPSSLPPAGGLQPTAHIRARTVFDLPGAPGESSGALDGIAPQCVGAEILDVSQWPPDPDPARAISLARGHLVTELDAPDTERIEALVRTYLAFGFGAEARSVISEMGDGLRHRAMYLEMARIVDDEPLVGESPFSAATGCDGPTALWAFIAQTEPASAQDVNLKAIQSWFVRLPDPLRLQLGPRLVERLAMSGFSAEAAAIRDAIARMGVVASPELSCPSSEFFGGLEAIS